VTAASLEAVLRSRRVLVCVGAGGVGKTTLAAALAMRAAALGRSALVCTIDPARRLANALGLTWLGNAPTEVRTEVLSTEGITLQAPLRAMMLDLKASWDELIQRQAPPGQRERILQNRFYQTLSTVLAGSQEYIALERLGQLRERSEADLIVLDTPPTAHALDFLDAPQKLTAAIDSPAIDWFRKIRGQKVSRSVIGRTGSYILGRLSKFVGSRFLDDLAIFFTEFNDILGGFRQRAEETFALLRQPSVGFLLVASPEPMAIRETLFFHQRLTGAAMPFSAFVVNRVHTDRPCALPPAEIAARLAALPPIADLGLQPGTLATAAEALHGSHRDLQALAVADAHSIARLRDADPDALIVRIPFLREDIHDISRLTELGAYLAS
jgi:anion-transporting  ArsA/GET3 family ATPase